MLKDQPQTVPGWYLDPLDPKNSVRYWDGSGWTDHHQPIPEPRASDGSQSNPQQISSANPQPPLARSGLTAVDQTPTRNGHLTQRKDIAEAYASLGKISRYARYWIMDNSEFLEFLGNSLQHDEVVAAVGVGQTGMAMTRGMVLTTKRICVIGSDPDWILNSDLINVRSMPSIRGQNLSFRSKSRRKNFSFWEVQPKGFAGQVSWLIKHPANFATFQRTPTFRKSTAKFLGGDFHGNVLSAAPPLRDGATVKIYSDGASELRIEHAQATIARYPLDYPNLDIDQSQSVGRGIRKGRLAAVAAASLLLTPLALAATPLATARRTRLDYAMAIEDDQNAGIFAITDSGFGAWLAAARGKATHAGNSATTNAGVLEKAHADLLTLQNLHSDGLLTDDEYQALRRPIIKGLSSR